METEDYLYQGNQDASHPKGKSGRPVAELLPLRTDCSPPPAV